jgi:signal transduction histidine kinase
MFRSIRWQLVLSYVLLTLLTVGMVGVLALSLIKHYVEQQEIENLTANAEAVAHEAVPLMWPVAHEFEIRELARTSSFLGNARVRILDEDRRLLADSWQQGGAVMVWLLPSQELWDGMLAGLRERFVPDHRSSGLLPFSLLPAEVISIYEELPPDMAFTGVRHWDDVGGGRFGFYGAEDVDEQQLLTAEQKATPRSERVITVPVGDRRNPLGYVEISKGPDLSGEALMTARRAFLLAGSGALLMAVVVGLLVSRRLSAPVRELTRVAGRMSSGDLSTRAPVRAKDEIGQLAGQFNQMAERLEVSFAELAAERDALRRFIADASHELRTPITALRSFNDLLQGAAAGDPAARVEFLTESEVQIDRLESITRNLLDLSRLDAGLIPLELGTHKAGDVIEAAASAFYALAAEKGIALSIRAPASPIPLRCDRARMELALSSLLDNALKFTPDGGQVSAGADLGDDVVRLWVRDTGSGIDPQDQPHIFERFYRGRSSRAEGSGLGLAIVQSVAQAHGGRVSVESEPGAGSLFVIDLPQR